MTGRRWSLDEMLLQPVIKKQVASAVGEEVRELLCRVGYSC